MADSPGHRTTDTVIDDTVPTDRPSTGHPTGGTDMAGETPITVVGNLTADPELRFTPSGAAVANFTVASTPRTFDKQSNEWKDGEALFLNCSVWRQAAENAAESLTRGMRVIVSGRLKARSYETREGEKRTVFEIDVEEVGPSMKYATAKVTKTSRSGGGGGGFQSGGGDDPWATPGGAQGGSNGGQAGSNGSGQGSGGGWGGQQGSSSGQADPWASSGAGGGHTDEPPF
jgi:single-strand DNA-binding protein